MAISPNDDHATLHRDIRLASEFHQIAPVVKKIRRPTPDTNDTIGH